MKFHYRNSSNDKLPLIENIFAILPLTYVAIEEIRQTAKRNIENHFSVVGLTSHMKSTFKLFEAYLPSFFSGASNYVEETEQKEGEVHLKFEFQFWHTN